jgi:endonuclease G, mitochondrial
MNLLKGTFVTTLAFLIQTNSAWARVEAVIGSLPLKQNDNLAMTMPTTKNSEILISREQYLISYNKERRAPNWVAWKLETSQLGKVSRSNKFQQDPDLEEYLNSHEEGHAVQPTDYRNSCFDRGHQCPSGDRTDTEADNEPTFEMSNMIPQTPYLNRVIWEHLENYTRSLVLEQGKKVYVIAGPIYDEDFGSIGPDQDIPVPSKDFKIVFILDADQSANDITSSTPYIAVIMPNILKNGQKPVANTKNCGGSEKESSGGTSDDWKQYQTTLKDIESASGITFKGI